MSTKLSSDSNNTGLILTRYLNNPTLIEHLASHYVLGTLSPHVINRVNKLVPALPELEQAIDFWQNRLIECDQHTTPLAAHPETWQNITKQLNHRKGTPVSLFTGFKTFLKDTFSSFNKTHYALAMTLMLLTLTFINNTFTVSPINDNLSYVAVLTNENDQAHMVATTYGESKKLIINLINPQSISSEESLELWVISKTDKEARSLGLLNKETLSTVQLSEAEWRLIKDSESLIVTLEENGGSPIGEPSETIISQGLCVRLMDWQQAS